MQCCGGRGPLPTSDRERPGHERGMKVSAEPLSAIGVEPSLSQEPKLRVFELALSGILTLTVPVAGHADPVRSKMGPVGAGPAPSNVQVWGGNGPGYHPMPNGWDGDWRRVPSPSHQWNGRSVSRRWWPNAPLGGWACCLGPGVPVFWVWGPSGGAFDYPFSDWRGPTGGWGNP